MVKPAKLILLMLPDLIISLCVCVSVSLCVQQRSVEAAFLLTTAKAHSVSQESFACIQEQEHACEEVCWFPEERAAGCPEYRCYEHAWLIFWKLLHCIGTASGTALAL